MTDDARLPDPLAAARALPKGSLVIVRAKSDPAPLARALLKLRRVAVIVAGDPLLAAKLGADGYHLPEARAGEIAHWRARLPSMFVTASAHSLRALMQSRADAVLLSPVFSTESHPGRAALTPVRANLMAGQARRPVYALGGIEARNAALLHGFDGIAAIGALRP
ncbi:MAG TPA: thiamine phosphate synthase [Rhizomicrobium sp.]|nr:thiamine phosphate synthase [Rhizomicrobium sp.]